MRWLICHKPVTLFLSTVCISVSFLFGAIHCYRVGVSSWQGKELTEVRIKTGPAKYESRAREI
jgi:hypothetical protein